MAVGRLAGRLVANGMRYRLLRASGRPGRLQVVSLEITRRCICRCVMCGIWKVPQPEEELSLVEWVDLLSGPRLTDVRELDITGGEPFLRDDLLGLVEAVCRLKSANLSRLRSIAITTNGVLAQRVVEMVTKMLVPLRSASIELVVVCALDAVGELHDRIRRHKGAWENVDRCMSGLLALRDENPNLIVGLKTTILPLNVDQPAKIVDYARERGLFTIVSPAIATPGRYLNAERAAEIELDSTARERLARFYEGVSAGWSYHARSVARYLRSGRAKRPCSCGFNYLFVRSNGDVFLCPLFEEPIGNLRSGPLPVLLHSTEARRIRRRVGRAAACRHCTEPGLERYSFPYEGWAYLGRLFRLGPRRFLGLHGHLGLDKYV